MTVGDTHSLGEHRFAIGERVSVAPSHPDGNPRTPPYARGKTGTVVLCHGRVPNPLDHVGVYPPLCTVRFQLEDLTGRSSRDAVTADLHEEWLAPVQDRTVELEDSGGT